MGFVGSIADFRDQEAFRAIVRRSKRLGFMGASAIHPMQVPVLNEEFGVSDGRSGEGAERMVAAYDAAFAQGLGAVQFEGAMIDVPVVQRAQNVLATRSGDQAPDGVTAGPVESGKGRHGCAAPVGAALCTGLAESGKGRASWPGTARRR